MRKFLWWLCQIFCARHEEISSRRILDPCGQKSSLHTSLTSGVQQNPELVTYHELILTTKEYMRNIMVIDAKWLINLASFFYRRASTGEWTPTRWPRPREWKYWALFHLKSNLLQPPKSDNHTTTHKQEQNLKNDNNPQTRIFKLKYIFGDGSFSAFLSFYLSAYLSQQACEGVTPQPRRTGAHHNKIPHQSHTPNLFSPMLRSTSGLVILYTKMRLVLQSVWHVEGTWVDARV